MIAIYSQGRLYISSQVGDGDLGFSDTRIKNIDQLYLKYGAQSRKKKVCTCALLNVLHFTGGMF